MPIHLASAIVLVSALLAAQGTEGLYAPANTWHTHGGSASRSGHSLTPALRVRPAPAWSHALPAGETLEGEPLVWHNLILLCARKGGTRTLYALNLRDGSQICRPLRFTTTVPLAPSLWRQRLVLRSSPRTVQLLRISRPAIKVERTWAFPTLVAAPLFFDDEVYVNTGGLHCLDPDKGDTRWEKGESLVGSPSLRGKAVFCLQAKGGYYHIVSYRRRGGRGAGRFGALPRPAGQVADPGYVYLGAKGMIGHWGASRQLRTGQGNQAINAFSPGERKGLFGARKDNIFHLRGAPCFVADGWIGLDRFPNDQPKWVRFIRDPRRGAGFVDLANQDSHAELIRAKGGASIASGVVYLAGIAFDATNGQVLWRHPAAPLQRPIPVRDGLLLVEAPNRLCLFRGGAAAEPQRQALLARAARPAPPAGKFTGRVVLRDGVRNAPGLQWVAERGSFRQRGKDLPKAELALVFDRRRKLCFWAEDPDLAAAGLGSMIEAEVDKAYFKLAKNSRFTNHKPTIEHYLRGTIARGGARLLIAQLRNTLRSKSAFKRKADLKRVARLRKEETALYQQALDKIWQDFESLTKVLPLAHALACAEIMLQHDAALLPKVLGLLQRFEQGMKITERLAMFHQLLQVAPSALDLLWQRIQPQVARLDLQQKLTLGRWVLDLVPDHKGVADMVRALNPLKVPGAEKISAEEWLEMIEVTRDLKLSLVELPADLNNFEPTPEIRELARQTRTWRKDLIAVQSERVILFTPLANPGRIARCLSMGELVCDTLVEMFAFSEKKRSKALRLKIVLYSSHEEYLKQSIKRGAGHGISWSAGHYSPMERCAFMFLPADEGAFNSVLDVFAHELTHYWLDVQCPLFDFYNQQRMIVTPGFWVVEGFPGMIEGFQFDLARRKVAGVTAANADLDMVASARANQLLPFKIVLGLSQLDMHRRLSPKPGRDSLVRPRWKLGSRPQSQIGMFYAQAAATCHYLYHAEQGKHRRQLLEYVGRYYRGERLKLGIQRSFGMSPKELGRRVVAYARTMTR